MFSSVRHALARVSLRRPANLRTLTDSVASDALQHAAPNAGEASILSTLSSSQPPAVASSSSSLAHTAVSGADTAAIHIPPAEDPLLHLFTSCVMKHGKRQQATRFTTKMLLHLHAFTKAPPLPIFREAIAKASPLLRCRQFKRAAKQYVFPMPLNERQRARQAIEWILESSDKKGGKHRPERVAREVIAVIKGDSEVIKKKVDVHKLAVLHRGNVLRPPKVPKSNRV
ncbi:ribosomal protein S7 [Cubamyces lactineus]|nr:ribosomal protein S7 [Cubamyces lactineus]